MTLTELRYLVTLAREKHFGRAAEACYVAQPTLTQGIKRIEDDLEVDIFERHPGHVTLTAIGERIIAQAKKVLEETIALREIAEQGKDPLNGPLQLGIIYSIAPYLLPYLIPRMIQEFPSMPLLIEENFTHRLVEMLKHNEIDVAILATPAQSPTLSAQAVYDEPFWVALPSKHPWCKQEKISAEGLKQETMLLLGHGHCLRDQVLQLCPETLRSQDSKIGIIQRSFEGSSLETIRHMVASGIGLTVIPALAVPKEPRKTDIITYRPFLDPVPKREVTLVWRKSYPRQKAIECLREIILQLPLPRVSMTSDSPIL